MYKRQGLDRPQIPLLVVGLGNPGKRYQHTRHNIGFILLDYLALKYHLVWNLESKFYGEIASIRKDVCSNAFFLKPQTYMNDSGKSVKAFCDFYKIPLSYVLVIHDDLDISLGSMRIKKGGSSGGHNGLKSLDSHCGNEYVRLRLGISRPQKQDLGSGTQDITDYVLGDFRSDERQRLEKIILYGSEAVEFFLETCDFVKLQNAFHKKTLC